MLPATNVMDTDSSLILPDQTCQRLTLVEVQSATRNFDDTLVIGRGGFGKVYKSLIKIGPVNEVAIKRLDSTSHQGASEFEAEVKVLSKLRHANLVPLIGYCYEGSEMVLAYEYMPNRTLKDHLCKADSELSWLQRLKICIGAARGLDYLHTGTATQEGVIHRDVKSSNILLDANLSAKISDFGLAKVGPINQTRTYVSTGVKGTFGYMDPCYFFSGKLTRKSDVYAFGVVLFEVLTGKQAVDSTLDEDQWSLAAWVQDQIKEGKLNKIIDSRVMGQISKKSLKEFAGIAGKCLHAQPKKRPTMAEVVVKLESILSHEREIANSVDERRFIDKVTSFFIGSKSEVSGHHIQKSNNGSPRVFTYAELVSATNNFQDDEYSSTLNEIIYKGWVDETTYSPTQSGVGLAMYVRKKDFRTSKLYLKSEEFNHPNLVKLLGYCVDKDGLFFCVYELIPYVSLDKLLYGEPHETSLSWFARLKIAVGVAQGLAFLHQRNHPAYLQFKTSLILVDGAFSARLSDFEVENSSYSFYTDAPYAAPEWFRYQADILDGIGGLEWRKAHDGFGVKSEIYSFGVVLLEILMGMKVVDVNRPEGQQNLVKWATPILHEDDVNLGLIMDPKLNHYPPKGALNLAVLVSKCLQPTQEKRPSMEEILQVLDRCYQDDVISHHIQKSNNESLRTFTYSELMSATNNFIDEKHFPSYCKGWLDERTYTPTKRGVGLAIYVKKHRIRTSKLDLKLEEFNHPNLVRLLGYCLIKKEFYDNDLLCVYELIPSTSLDKLLFRESGGTSLSWVERLKIAFGAAQGVSFLHLRNYPAYRQFKTSHILVDTDFYARLSGFELENSFVSDGSYPLEVDKSYAAPEFFRYLSGIFDESVGFERNYGYGIKSEIYSYGVVLLEILTGKNQSILVKRGRSFQADKGKLPEIMDPQLTNYPPDAAFKLLVLVSKCLRYTRENRPSMEEILQVLYDVIKMKSIG